MRDRLLLGVGRHMIPLPRALWRRALASGARKSGARTGFMTDDHHRVRDFAVGALPGHGGPLAPEAIAEALGLPVSRVVALLDDLERHLTFVFRNDDGAVTWAYPVTVDETPHHATFSTGEEAWSPWAVDTFAMPFVQGHLRSQPVSVRIRTQCAHCRKRLHFEVDSELRYRMSEVAADPLVFLPLVDFDKLKAPSIIDAFWRKSVFFWSEEHAKEQRRQQGGPRGVYLTLGQAAWITPLAQGPLFALPRS